MDSVHGDSRPRRFPTRSALLRNRKGADDDWRDLTWDETLRRLYAGYLASADHPPRLRIGRGETVGRAESEAYNRRIFARALFEVVPETTTRLVTAEALDVEHAFHARHDEALTAVIEDPHLSEQRCSVDVLAAANEPFAEAVCAKWAVIDRWQCDFQLEDDWLACLAWDTLSTALRMRGVGLEYVGPLGLGAMTWESPAYELDDSESGREIVLEHGHPIYPVFVDDLKHAPDEPGFDLYDPDEETVKAATDRLLEALRPRVCHVLEAIVAEHQALTDALPSMKKETSAAFEWLVRYQVRGESKNAVAKSVGKDRSHVLREVNRAADLIGLTLRNS